MLSALLLLLTAGCSPSPCEDAVPGSPAIPEAFPAIPEASPAGTSNRHRSELQRRGASAAGRDGESEELCVSLWQGCIRRLWFYGWLKPLGFKFDILDRGAPFDCCICLFTFLIKEKNFGNQ